METVNLVVGIVAIVVSLTAIVLSFMWSQQSQRAEERSRDTLRQIESKADDIHRDVQDRMDELIRRAAPSVQEQTESQAMMHLFGAVVDNPDVLERLTELAERYKDQDE